MNGIAMRNFAAAWKQKRGLPCGYFQASLESDGVRVLSISFHNGVWVMEGEMVRMIAYRVFRSTFLSVLSTPVIRERREFASA